VIIFLEFEGISEEERVNAGKTEEELRNSGFMLLNAQQVWIPMQLWDPQAKYTFKYD